MADKQQPRSEGEADAHSQEPEAEPSSAPSIDEQVKNVLRQMADSGELFGGGGDSSSPREQPAHAPAAPAPEGPDLEERITRVLQRRDEESKEQQRREGLEQTIAQLQARLEHQERRTKPKEGWRKWLDPANPFGG